jgi:uncharacterized membrane protein (UPF0127 family)
VSRFLGLVVIDALEAPSAMLLHTGVRATAARVRRNDGASACDRCIVADSALKRMRGLLGRDGLEPGEGLLLKPAGSIHTAFMRFAIDAVFLDKRSRVVKIASDVKPWRAVFARRSRSVLELRAGECARRGLAVGDVLEVVR